MIEKMKIKGAIFDMDGTLVDSLMFWEGFWRAFGKKYKGCDDYVPPKYIDSRVRAMMFADATAWICEELKPDATPQELYEFGNQNLDEHYRNVVTVKAGVFEFLEHLKSRGIKCCVATATEMEFASRALEYHGITKYLDAAISCTDIGVGKDKPDIYLKAGDILGFSEDELCVFEDSYVALETAKNAGFKTVGIFDKYNYCQDRLEAASNFYLGEGHSFTELIEKID